MNLNLNIYRGVEFAYNQIRKVTYTILPFFCNPTFSMKALNPNVTSPEPFEMMIRDENRTLQFSGSISPCGTYAASQNFHSSHVPAHVYLPIYHLIAEQSQKLKEGRIDSRMQSLLAQVNTFNLSASGKLYTADPLQTECMKKSNCDLGKFKASPFPSHLFHEEIKSEKELVEQLRQARIKARAVEMMKQSSLPFTQRKDSSHGTHFLSTNKETPSPGSKKVQDNINTPKCIKRNFIAQNKRVSCLPKEKKLSTMNQNVQPNINTKLVLFEQTKTTELRKAKTQKEQEKIDTKKEQAFQTFLKHKTRQMELQKEVSMKMKMHNQLQASEDIMRQKLLAHKHSQQIRLQEYESNLKEMRDRLKKRPLLIEQQSQQASRDAALKCIQARKLSLPFSEAITLSGTQSQKADPDVDRTESSEEVDDQTNSDFQ